MEGIEQFLNRLSDQDWNWWPCLSLRPAPDEPMTTKLVAQITLIYGPVAGLACSAIVIGWLSLAFGPLGFHEAMRIALLLTSTLMVTFFIGYRSTVVVAWNRRAARLLTDPAYGGVLPDEPFDPGAYGTYGVWVPRGPLRRRDDV